MSTTTMHFGPEWMRPKQQSISRPQQPPSPPPSNPLPSGVSTYSALVSPVPPTHPGTQDEAHPFRYSKEELLKIYKDGSGKSGLGLEVERWDGVVRDFGSDPVALREMGEAEKKLFAGPLNSDIRRRQSTDYLSPLSTSNLGPGGSRLNHNSSAVGSPMRERFGNAKRRDSNADSPNLALPRKQSLSSLQAPTMSPREVGLPSPRTRVGYTPSFDGVLNGGDSWIARRRASEASQRAGGNPTNLGEEGDINERAGGIREEREEENDGHRSLQDPSPRVPEGDPFPNNELGGVQSTKGTGSLVREVGQLSLNTHVSSPVDSLQKHPGIGAPPGLGDLSSVEWSYKDPTGTVQGPFRADLMQKWCDDGYFTPDLPMRRTHLDTTWSTLEQLRRRSESDKVFLTPLRPIPPGLVMRNDSPLQYNAVDQTINGPYQPAPIRSLRTSTLESYISTGSNHSESPSSSFGGGRFGDSSPEPNTFGGRTIGNEFYNGDPSGSARGSGFQTTPEIPSTFPGRRVLHAEPPLDSPLTVGSPAFGAYGIPSAFGPTQGHWGTPPGNTGPGYEVINPPHDGRDHLGLQNYPGQNLGGNYGGLRSSQDPVLDPHPPAANYSIRSDHGNHTVGGDQHGGFNFTPGTNDGQLYPHAPQQFNTLLQQHQHSSLSPLYVQQGILPPTQNNIPTQQSPWSDVTEAKMQGTGPFDNPHPTANNTAVESTSAVAQAIPWDQPTQPISAVPVPKDASPWVITSHGTIDGAWTEPPEDVEAPGPIHATAEAQPNPVEPTPTTAIPETLEEAKREPEPVEESPAPAPPTGPSRSGKSRKQTSQTSKEPSSKAAVVPAAPPAPQPKTPSPPPAVPKPAWQKEDETKKTISLREIQEAEARKVEAKKTAERERERAARAAANSPDKEDIQPFTASWGLPTSQAGSRSTPLPVKEVVSSPTTAAVVPVWTAAPKIGAKKTMKEILEEEEKRKKTAPQVTAAVAVAATGIRRLSAEPSVKSPPPPTSGGVWTTVGPSGKANVPPPIATHAKPAAPPTVPGASRTNGPTPTRPTAAPKPSTALVPRVEDVIPSHEFLNWLNDSLKGLHNSVSVEEIMNMLLTFPIEVDASIREIISETIYTNSTTMDGRRFAEEFVSRRKADAIAHAKNGGAPKGSVKPASIADVVKAAPKTTQPEWGFKVVNKKKKGGRS